ncbi:hypothetical protein FSP39_006081 [Pinctada imbricata]|uniref:VWFA domain-containing protein n=1 Tax=Pinctada imbricata TaxID=66713 RepID=A0AA88Y3D3_PINIB|nr:hypothetical protein FSP39_006081 [Pinctada imbricata]
MEFGSDCVYLYDKVEYESISDEEYEAGMVVSRYAYIYTSVLLLYTHLYCYFTPKVPPPPPPPPTLALKKAAKLKKVQKAPGRWKQRELNEEVNCNAGADSAPRPSQAGRRERRADTNIVSIDFQKVISPSNMHTGDPVHCFSCGAVLSSISRIQNEGDNKVWICEFCETKNILEIEVEEIPKNNDVTFMLEPSLSTSTSGPTGLDESLVIFCVDISGSMCVTTEVPGRINLRGSSNLNRLQSLNTDRSDQYLPNQRRNVTYISRLQAAQAAVDHQLEEMIRQHPNRRVALIAFNNEVSVIGDGSNDAVTIAGEKLTKIEELEKMGAEIAMPESVVGSRKRLGEKLFGLEEGGATALGPALLVACTMASQHPGSKVIICTDGKANVGLGRLDLEGEEVEGQVDFYEDVGRKALDKGVSVSVISIKGTDCKLVHLGKVADTTGGQVNIVDPLKLTQEFSTILADRIIATNVTATFIIHKELFFFYEDTEESKVVRNVGNVSASTEITFEYGVRCHRQKKEKKEPAKEDVACGGEEAMDTSEAGIKPEEQPSTSTAKPQPPHKPPNEVPFQLQVKYTDVDGAVALRVVTQLKPTTYDRREAEKKMNIDVLGKHTAQTAAKLALDGQYTQSRGRALMNQRLAWRYTNTSEEGQKAKGKYKRFFGKIQSVDHYMNKRQQEERSTHGRTYSDDEDEEPQALMAASLSAPAAKPKSTFSKLFQKKGKKKMMRSSECSDEGANIMYQLRKGSRYLDESDSD